MKPNTTARGGGDPLHDIRGTEKEAEKVRFAASYAGKVAPSEGEAASVPEKPKRKAKATE